MTTGQGDRTGPEPWRDFPPMAATTGRVEPAPRRVRAVLAGRTVLDSTRALYVWEHERYPQYYVPLADMDPSALVQEDRTQKLRFGTVRRHGLRVGDTVREGVVRLFGDDALPGLAGHVRVEWSAMDAWFEEEEQVFVHPRNPYTRVDAVRSSRHVRVELDGTLLAESHAPVLVFETGLPTRYYLDPSAVRFAHLRAKDTRTECPYKGRTTGYWDAVVGDTVVADAAWSYAFATPAMAPIAGLVAFLNERLDLVVDGRRLARPASPFS